MKYLDPKFSSRPASKAYRDNWDRVFGRPDGITLTRPGIGPSTWEGSVSEPRPALQGTTKREVDQILGRPKKPRRRKP